MAQSGDSRRGIRRVCRHMPMALATTEADILMSGDSFIRALVREWSQDLSWTDRFSVYLGKNWSSSFSISPRSEHDCQS